MAAKRTYFSAVGSIGVYEYGVLNEFDLVFMLLTQPSAASCREGQTKACAGSDGIGSG